MDEVLHVSPEKMARYADLATKAVHNFETGLETEFLNSLKLKLPHFEQSPAVSSITLAKATKNVPHAHATRQLAELMEHFPQEDTEQGEIKQQKIELALEGTCAELDATVKFSPRTASFGIRKPAAEPVGVAERMVDHALGYVSGWRNLVAKVRDPQMYDEVQDSFLDMLATARLMIDANNLNIPQNDRASIIARFERDCQAVGLNEPEAAFMNIGTIFHQARSHMGKVGTVATIEYPYYSMSQKGRIGCSAPDQMTAFLKKALASNWIDGSGKVVERAAIYVIKENMLKTGNDDEIGRLFQKLELVGADQEALKDRMVLRALYATGGRDAALSYYFRRRYGERFMVAGDQVELRMSNFREIARALEGYGMAVGVPIDLNLNTRRLEGSSADLLEDIGFLKNASEVILDETQEIDFLSEIRKTSRGENNVPIMFVGRSGAGKTTLAAAFGDMILTQRQQGYEDMILYVPKRKGGEGVMTAQEVESAILEFAVDAIYNREDGKFRYLAIDDLHHIGLDPNQWRRIHQILNLVNPYLKDNPNAKIAITSEESPNTVALQAAQRIKKFNANTLWAQDKPTAKVGKHMKLALTKKCKIPDERATAIAKLIIDTAKAEADKREGAVPLDAITFGFVVRDVGDNIAQETNMSRIEGYVKEKLTTRFNEIQSESEAKRRDEVAILLETFQTQLASLEANAETDRTAWAQLKETVTDLQSRGQTDEQIIQQVIAQNAQMQETITGLLQAFEEEKAARRALEEKIMQGAGGTPPVATQSEALTAVPPSTPPPPATPRPRGDLLVSTRTRRGR